MAEQFSLSNCNIKHLTHLLPPPSGVRPLGAGGPHPAAGEVLHPRQQRHPGLEGDRTQPHRGIHPGAGRRQRRTVQGGCSIATHTHL